MTVSPRALFSAILAMDVYNRGYGQGLVVNGDHLGNAKISSNVTTPASWSDSSFFAQQYTLESAVGDLAAGTTIISYRGTDKITADAFQGWPLGGGNFAASPEATLAAQFFFDVANTTPLSNIRLTGHSLGGGLAGFISGLYGLPAFLFDNMTFELALNDFSLAQLEPSNPVLVPYTSGPITPHPDFPPANTSSYYIPGEILELALPARNLSQLTPLIPISSYAVRSPIDLHSISLLVNIMYADEKGHTAWHPIGQQLVEALFNDTVATAVGFVSGNSTGTGGYTASNKMRDAIAYSAIEQGFMPFGDKAIVALFNDADTIGRTYSASTNWLLGSSGVKNALAEIAVQHAGDLALNPTGDPLTQSGVIAFDSANGLLNISIDHSNWVSTFNNATPHVVGVTDLVAALEASAHFSATGLFPIWAIDTSKIDTSQITEIAAATIAGSATIDVSNAPLSWFGPLQPGGALLIGGTGASQLTGGAGDDWLIGSAAADTLYGGAGDDFFAGNEGDDTIYGGTGLLDTAVYLGPSSQYDWKVLGDGKVTVTHKTSQFTTATANGLWNEGNDTLFNVERLQFTDKVVVVGGNIPFNSLEITGAGSFTTDGGINPVGGGASGSDLTPLTPSQIGKDIVGDDISQQLYGSNLSEKIYGGGGDDVLTGFGGQDSFYGGQGSDTVDYSYEPSTVSGTIDFSVGAATFPGFYTESLTSIENVWMGAGNDKIIGDAGDNDLRGGPGDDILQGGLGNDHIYGDWKYSDQGGNDTAILSYTFGTGYTVSGSANALHIVGAEGDDWYYNVESFEFAGGVGKTAAELMLDRSFDASTQTIERVSILNSGAEGNLSSSQPSISADGRYVAFSSDATNLVVNDTNGFADAFVFDRITRTIQLVSLSSSGTYGSSTSYPPVISADGHYVAFTSLATNLVPDDTNGQQSIYWGGDVFVHDLQAQTTDRVSIATNGTQGDLSSGISINGTRAAISTDGRFVAFSSQATTLDSRDTNHLSDIFLHDRLLNSTVLVSLNSDGTPLGLDCSNPSISADGRFIAFEATPVNTLADLDVYVYDTQTLQLTLASVASDETPGNFHSIGASVSADGHYVAFESSASNLVPGDTNSTSTVVGVDIFVRDQFSGVTERVSVSSNGAQSNNNSTHASISADGRFIVFSSTATNLVPGDTNQHADIFVFDRLSDVIQRLSVADDGAQANGDSLNPSISADGRVVTFESLASNLVPGDTNGIKDVFVVDRLANHSPAAEPDSIATSQSDSVGGNVLLDNGFGSDRDPDGDPLVVTAVNGHAVGPGHAWMLTSGANLTVNADGRFTYDPNHAFDNLTIGQAATDTFSYTISDGQGHTSTATVTLTITGTEHGLQVTNATGTVTGTSGDDQIFSGPSDTIVHGLAGVDWLQGGDATDTLYGDDGSDIIQGGAGTDVLYGGAGYDWLVGGAGNDTIDGGGDIDTASYSGNRADYTITYNASTQTLTVSDLRAGTPDGVDTVTNVESFVFADGSVSLADIIAHAPLDISLSRQSVAENSSAGTIVGNLSASDPDTGDTFSYSLLDSAGGVFAIQGANLTVTGALDYESAPSHNVSVRVTDSTGNTFDKQFTIAITNVNEAPTAVGLTNTVTQTPENGASLKVADIVVTDDALGTNTLSLSGADASAFTIKNSNELWFDGQANFEAKSNYAVTVSAADPTLPGSIPVSTDYHLAITDVNEAPQSLTASNLMALPENAVTETIVADLSLVDPDTNPAYNSYAYSVSDSRFAVSGGHLVLKAGQAVDFEQSHGIALTVTATNTDNPAHTLTIPVSIAVTDVNDNAPIITTAAQIAVAENSTFVSLLSSTDADTVGTNPATFTISGGADAALFDVVGGALVFRAPRDFETQAHTYAVDVTANDGANQTTKSLSINLTNVNEAPTALALLNAAPSILENTPLPAHLKVADIAVADDALGTNTLSLSGTDASFFEIVGTSLYLKPGTHLDFETKSTYSVSVSAHDASLPGSVAVSTGYLLHVGNVSPETINGTAAADTLTGGMDTDLIFGFGGNDTLNGGAGNDTLTGGLGRDIMTGGAGSDRFDFNTIAETGKIATTRDIVRDFVHGTDKVDLSTIDAKSNFAGNQAFSFISLQAFHHVAGELRYFKFDVAGSTNDKTIVEGDVNGDALSDFQIEFSGLKVLTAPDFVL